MNEFSLASWLKSIGYSGYYHNFKTRGYDTYYKCCNILDQDLDAMGIQQMAVRKAILTASTRLSKGGHGAGPPLALADSDNDDMGSSNRQKQYHDRSATNYHDYLELGKEEDAWPVRGNQFPPQPRSPLNSNPVSGNQFPLQSRSPLNSNPVSPQKHFSPDSNARFRATSFTHAVEMELSKQHGQQHYPYIPLHLQNGSSRRLKKIPPIELKMILHDKLVEDGVDLTREPYSIEVGIKADDYF